MQSLFPHSPLSLTCHCFIFAHFQILPSTNSIKLCIFFVNAFKSQPQPSLVLPVDSTTFVSYMSLSSVPIYTFAVSLLQSHSWNEEKEVCQVDKSGFLYHICSLNFLFWCIVCVDSFFISSLSSMNVIHSPLLLM